MTDPTTPTTEAGRALLETIAIAERLSPNGVRVRNYIPPILAIEAEAAASALSALRAEVEGMPAWMPGNHLPTDMELTYWRWLLSGDAVLAAIDRIAKAEPEPKCEHGVPVALACRACRDAKAEPEGAALSSRDSGYVTALRDHDECCGTLRNHKAEPEGESRG